MSSFKGGVHPPETKLAATKAIEGMPIPQKVVLPLSQHTGSPAKVVVKSGDLVKTGQIIAESTGFISSNVHSSVSGKILAVEKQPHPSGYSMESVVIESDGKDEKAEFKYCDPEKISPSEMIDRVKDAGIVGLGGAAFPTHVKLSPPKDKKIDSFILNGCECEPYLTCDHRVMLEDAEKVYKGLRLIMKILGVENAYIAIENNKKNVLEKFIPENSKSEGKIKIVLLKTRYPQGAEKQLIKAVLNREVPSGKLPMDVGCVVQNVQTAKAIYDAICEGKPLYERVVSVTGSVKTPKNLRVRLGTPVSELIDFCGGFDGDIKKLIIGGPMMGVSQASLDIPVIKGVSGILALTDKASRSYEPSNCIRCGRCVDDCPMRLLPTIISRLAELKRFEDVKEYSPMDCIECGCCAYVCPAKIHLVQNIKIAKLSVQKGKA